ncbi:syntaxin, Qa-SNARE family, putative [Plasmodium gallinaceum]|uniref:Syntaxin, Qa-SNARE family, putative n=1 Tax=Plasmodium gallinaceum TaxID=5849 RepID=A0A1J1GXU0_PLAGA|nr:syntaxin, Qa-SNARE family, putative [Plasmodium gallinaceum]CRG95824.1 syntaxin, Qa-SNARE family, putative [Plasmodium gallinaceum]
MEDILNEIISLSEKKREEKEEKEKKKKKKNTSKDDDNYNFCDASTNCTVDDDLNIEKINIFSKIINDNKTNESDMFEDIEKNICENTPLFQNENTLNTYLLNVNDININISNIYKNIDKINVIKKKIDLNIYDNEKLYKKVNLIINDSEKIIEYIKIKINDLNKENNEFEKSSNMISEIKLRINIFIDVVNKYKGCINKYKNICNQYYEYVNKNIIKHYKLIHPNLSDHKIHKLIKQNNHSIEDFLNMNKTYQNSDIYSTNVEQIEIEKIKEKYNELKNLEKSILSLNELYIELAYVIKKRKNVINNIENNVFQVREYTEDALINIIEAKKYNAMIKQKILYFSIFLLIVAFIILFPIFFNFTLF